jgi:hypothetical protein
MTITAQFIDSWALRYPVEADREILEVVGPRVVERRAFDRADLLTVGRWKSVRSSGYLSRNTDTFIEQVTSTSLRAPDDIKHLVLTLLEGVGVPMASAMLTACFPNRFTVIDVRALATLRALGIITPGVTPDYVSYVATCRSIADETSRDLRTLDRALYSANGRTDSRI